MVEEYDMRNYDLLGIVLFEIVRDLLIFTGAMLC